MLTGIDPTFLYCFRMLREKGTREVLHDTTLSPDSKMALRSGDPAQMSLQLRRLHLLWKQSSPVTRGPTHRHVIAFKRGITQHIKQLIKLAHSAKDKISSASIRHSSNLLGPQSNVHHNTDNSPKSPNVLSDRDTLNKRWMRHKKTQKLMTRKKAKAVDSLNQGIYKYYYQKLTKLTKMRVDPVNPSYMNRTMERIGGVSPEYNMLSYKEKFRILLYKVNLKWKPRDYVQRICDFKSLFSRLCTNIMDCIRKCTSNDKGGRLDSMDRLDNLFIILKRFKISSPTFRKKVVHRGGGPKKRFKGDDEKFEHWGKRDVIGKDQLSVPTIESFSAMLKTQFNMEHGLLNVDKLYRASHTSGPVCHRLNRFNLVPIPLGSKAVQIHFCSNHYVTSEQRPSGIVVWDSLQTSDEFKMDLYPQLQLTYDILSQYSQPPKGLIKYVTDSNNMQNDTSSCGIYAVLRAYSILCNTSHKINIDVARSYLSSVLEKGTFTNYDMFSSNCQASKMNVMLNKYMSNQKEMHTNKSRTGFPGSTETVSKDVTQSTVKRRGRPQKRKKHGVKLTASSSETNQDISVSSVRKLGRPVMYSNVEKAQRIKESKLKHYHKNKADKSTNADLHHAKHSKKQISQPSKKIQYKAKQSAKTSDLSIKMGRPRKYSPNEKVLKDRESKLKYYHKSKKENTMENVQKLK